MAPFATIYSWPGNPRLKRSMAVAALNNLELSIPAFDMMSERTSSFYQKFPLGKVPALETPDGFTLVESGAIATFIADSGPKREQLLGRDARERAKIRQWMDHSDQEFTGSVQPVIQMIMGRRKESEEVRKEAMEKLERAFKYLEHQVANHAWVAETKDLTLADITLANIVDSILRMVVGKEWRDKFPKTVEWFERVIEQPGVKEAWGPKQYKD